MRTLIGLTIGFTLALAGTAAAKEISAIEVCGSSGCKEYGPPSSHAAVEGGAFAEAPERAAPHFSVQFTMRHGDGEGVGEVGMIRMQYLQEEGLLQYDDGTWLNPTPRTERALDRLVRGVEPFPAARLLMPAEETEAAPAAAAAPSPPRPATSGAMPDAAWAFLIAGAAGVLAALAVGARTVVGRRRGPAEAG